MLHSAELICIMLGGVCVPAMLTQANVRRKKAGTISADQLGDHVRTNTIIVVNSMMGYQASFRFTPLATFLTLEPHESLLCIGWNCLNEIIHNKDRSKIESLSDAGYPIYRGYSKTSPNNRNS
ncbi:hypothetical protein CLF_109847 [Clonorchis sinensis]|uniref:Uncharacterized protein n=1 Tax=Clonorchis sinensis TaxID=79923 RepID=G7YSZ9_CLOSI|nr:hypothetical protein CLF_109847 [Clonorchis sinensis]